MFSCKIVINAAVFCFFLLFQFLPHIIAIIITRSSPQAYFEKQKKYVIEEAVDNKENILYINGLYKHFVVKLFLSNLLFIAYIAWYVNGVLCELSGHDSTSGIVFIFCIYSLFSYINFMRVYTFVAISSGKIYYSTVSTLLRLQVEEIKKVRDVSVMIAKICAIAIITIEGGDKIFVKYSDFESIKRPLTARGSYV